MIIPLFTFQPIPFLIGVILGFIIVNLTWIIINK